MMKPKSLIGDIGQMENYGHGPTNVRPWHPGQVEKYAGEVLHFQKKPIAS
mgnify:CR=1 FL=1